MNFLVWNRLCFPFLPLVVRRTHVQYGELRVRVSIVCPLLLSLSYSVHVSVCTSSRGGLNGFPTWSIVSRSLPFHPLTLPRPPIHPIPTRFPLVVGCLWRRDVSSLPLYITKNEEREREMFVFLFLLLFFFFFFFLFLFLVAALLLLDLIRRLISGGSTRHLFFKTKSRTSLRFLF